MLNRYQRNVNVEILRCIAMFMVLLLHANFLAFKSPKPDVIISFNGISRVLLQSLCIVAVNVFVMISGWFGIRPSIKGFCNFMWQVFYIVALVCCIEIIFFKQPFKPLMIAQSLGLYDGGGWFVGSYIALYILSPILNKYIQVESLKSIGFVLIAFFAFEIIWGNTNSVRYILGGYSAFSFIGLYVFSGWLRRLQIKIRASHCATIILVCLVINSLTYIFTQKYQIVLIRDMVFNYVNPLTIIQSAALLIMFTRDEKQWQKHPLKRKVILWFSSSCFAVYLLHLANPFATKTYLNYIKDLYKNFPNIGGVVLIFASLIVIFFVAVIMDKPRQFLWRKCFSRIFKSKQKVSQPV